MFTKLAGVKVRDIVHLNIFEGSQRPDEGIVVWMWSQIN